MITHAQNRYVIIALHLCKDRHIVLHPMICTTMNNETGGKEVNRIVLLCDQTFYFTRGLPLYILITVFFLSFNFLLSALEGKSSEFRGMFSVFH